MTPTELRALCAENTTLPLLVAFDAIGVSETAGRKAYARGDLMFRVIRVGSALRVPSCDLERLLLAPDTDEDPAPTGSHVTTDTDPTEARSDQSATLRAI